MKAVAYIILLHVCLALADNPIVQTYFTPDPAAMVHNDTLYVYAGHDEDIIEGGFFTMYDWRVYSTTDMVNYTDHGSPLSWNTFGWAGGKAWAAQAIYRNGKFYWYVTVGLKGSNQPAIGVAVSDSPTGPFVDALGHPLISQSWDDIDPTVFIDDDGQAYLYWGNPRLYYVRLNEDMISYSGKIQNVNMTTEAFGVRGDGSERETTYEEGPWFFKRENLYYMVYAAGPLPETIGYSTAPGPTGPWTYRGKIMSQTNTGSFTNHAAVLEYKGKGYFFYHTGRLLGGGNYHRSTAVESFDFGADGSIPELTMTNQGPAPVGTFNPYQKVEAETMAWSEGLKVDENSSTGVFLSQIDDGDYLKLSNIDFTTSGATSFQARYASPSQGGKIDLYLDSKTGTQIGSLELQNTGGQSNWKIDSTDISGANGIHDLYLVFRGSGFHVDYWQFKGGIQIPAHRDSIFNGNFEKGTIGWQLNTWAGEAQTSLSNEEYCVDISAIGTENYQIQLIQPGLILEQGKSYEILFDSHSDVSRPLEVNVEQHTDPWISYLEELQNFSLETTKNTYSFRFTMSQATDSNSRLSFNLGAATGRLCIDNVVFRKSDVPTNTNFTNFIISPEDISVKIDNGNLVIRLPEHSREAELKVFSLKGEVKFQKILASQNQSINLNQLGLKSGLYFFQIGQNESSIHFQNVFVP